MPRYSYECEDCGKVQDAVVTWEISEHPRPCECGGFAQKMFPVEAVKGIVVQGVYYDPSLGLDINGKREKKQILKAMGYEEAGDKVGGARDFDKHAPVHIDREKAKGITLSDIQRAAERSRKRKENRKFFKEVNGQTVRVMPQHDKSKMIHLKHVS